MKNPNQQTRIRKFWLKGFRPAMVIVASLLVLGTAVPLASAAPEQHYKFITVDARGKDLSNSFQLTWINDDGLVIQQYADSDNHSHTAALLRSGWTLIDVPGAANTGGTNPNSRGQVALSYWGDDGVMHLAIWERGHYTYIPDSAWEGYAFWGAQGINDRGQVSACVGNDDGSILYGWVGTSRHHTIFAYPGSTFTIAFMTNNSGTTVGEYVDADGNGHGFIKDGDDYESVDYPGGRNAYALGINNAGDIIGDYVVGPIGVGRAHGFLLQRGHLTPFDVPGAVSDFNFSITDNHTITGTYQAPVGSFHGFIAVPVGGESRRESR
jgi:hypothetical protein